MPPWSASRSTSCPRGAASVRIGRSWRLWRRWNWSSAGFSCREPGDGRARPVGLRCLRSAQPRQGRPGVLGYCALRPNAPERARRGSEI